MKRNLKRRSTISRTPQKKSPRKIVCGVLQKNSVKRLKKMKNLTYESPLNYLHQRRSKRQLIRDELSPAAQPMKRQKLSQKRDSVIIINDENDFDSFRTTKTLTAKAQSSTQKSGINDSVIILEDDKNQESSNDLNETEDVMVVWSSVTGSPEEANENQNSNSGDDVPFVFDVAANNANLRMLKGDFPKKCLGKYLRQQELNQPRNNGKGKRKDDVKVKKTEIHKEKKKKASKEILNGKLREIIIDGANVARAHSKGKYFSVAGLQIVIDYFQQRGHKVRAFVPQYERKRNRQILEDLNEEGIVTFTPSRKAGKKVITPYDDRFILKYAAQCEGIVVSNDQFKDLYAEKPEWRETIEKRILPPTFVGDHIMFPEDPLGRWGPNLDQFLKHDS